MRRLLIALLLVSTILLSAVHTRSYTLQSTDGSIPAQVRWPRRKVTVTLSSSLFASASIKPGSDVSGAIRRALAHWSAAANIQFIQSSSKAESISAPNSGGDGVSLLTIAPTSENLAPFAGAGAETSGRTRLFYAENGQITEADIALNPTQQFSTDGTFGTYDLEATLTHEVGHLLGLEHSGVAGATMQPRQGKNGLYKTAQLTPRTLSEDDRAGVRALYGARGGDAKTQGAVVGTITYAGGAPVYGAHVWAEEIKTGRVAAANITLANGTYRIEGLQPGTYRLWVEALDGMVAASEIPSGRGGYTGLTFSQSLPFRTQEIGNVKLSAGDTLKLNAQLSSLPVLLNPSFIGINEQLSTISVPLTAGYTYTVYLAGDGVVANQLSATGISVASPFLSVNPQSVAEQNFGNGLTVMSFELSISPNAPAGDYTVRLNSNTGEVACIAGGLSVEGADALALERAGLFVESIDAPGMAAMTAGSFVALNMAGLPFENVATSGQQSDDAHYSHAARHGEAAVNLTYESGASVYLPLTRVNRARLGFRIPSDAEPGKMLVELFLEGRKMRATAIEITGAEARVNSLEADCLSENDGPAQGSAPPPATEN